MDGKDEELDQRIDELLECIRSSDEYREYQRQKERISNDAFLKEAVDTLREISFRIQQDTDERAMNANMNRFMDENAELLGNRAVRDYLSAEDGLLSLARRAFEGITGGLDL